MSASASNASIARGSSSRPISRRNSRDAGNSKAAERKAAAAAALSGVPRVFAQGADGRKTDVTPLPLKCGAASSSSMTVEMGLTLAMPSRVGGGGGDQQRSGLESWEQDEDDAALLDPFADPNKRDDSRSGIGTPDSASKSGSVRGSRPSTPPGHPRGAKKAGAMDALAEGPGDEEDPRGAKKAGAMDALAEGPGDEEGGAEVGAGGGGEGAERATSPTAVNLNATAELLAAAAEEPLTEAELEAGVTINLSETATFFLFDLPSERVNSVLCPEENEAVEAEGAGYDELLKKKEGSDAYVDGHSQTLPFFPKHKETQMTSAPTAEAGTSVAKWQIHDAFNDGDGDGAAGAAGAGGASSVSGGTQTEPEASDASGLDGAAAGSASDEEAKLLALLSGLPESLKVTERILTQNLYHEKHLEYRNFRSGACLPSRPPTRAQTAEMAAAGMENAFAGASDGLMDEQSAQLLWSFQCSTTDSYNVSSLAWNKADADVVAVAYGQNDYSHTAQDGMVALWSLKNPEFPERVYKLPMGATSVDWSEEHPHILAVGTYTGDILIMDTRDEGEEPFLRSSLTDENRHVDPVWQLQYVQRGEDAGGECLVSISTDGAVQQWTMRKGLQHKVLMHLKELSVESGDTPAVSSRASGLCLDFDPSDPSIYLVGTERGMLHKCSVSYEEEYLHDFPGHTGPVYKVRLSPFDPNVFLTCSADWTVRLWRGDAGGDAGTGSATAPKATFSYSTHAINDVRWSPLNSCVFASVTADGHLDLWDMEKDVLAPSVSVESGHGRCSSLLFAPAAPVLLVGSDLGVVDVYRVNGMEGGMLTPSEQAKNLATVIDTSH